MFFGQDIIEVDGIEQKQLRITGEPDRVEVGNVTNRHAAVISSSRLAARQTIRS